jgi:hypothetical protein
LPYAFDRKRWKEFITEMQAIVASVERLPKLYHSCFELLKAVEDEALLLTMCSLFFEADKKLKSRLHKNEKPSFTTNGVSGIQRFFADIQQKYFSELEDDCIADGKHEFDKALRDRLIANCDKAMREVEKIRHKLLSKYGIANE